jgi:hypothetical protein
MEREVCRRPARTENGRRREVAEGWPRRPGGVIDASLKGRLGLVGFEEPVGEPVGDLELLGELSRRPFASRPTRVEVLRVQALPAGGASQYRGSVALADRE